MESTTLTKSTNTGTRVESGGIGKPVPVIKELNIGTVGKLIITQELQEIIDYLHKSIGSTEWSGVLFYKLTGGDVKTLKDLEFTAVFMYPMNIGSSTYTEHGWEGELINAYDIYEDAMNCSMSMLHSHHNMSAFFSGTDSSELKDNCINFNYYISLIVNFDKKYCAKIAFPSKSETTTKMSLKDQLGKIFNKQVKQEEQTILIGDLDIVMPETVVEETNWLTTRVSELKQKKAAIPAVTHYASTFGRGSYQQNSLWDGDDYDWPKTNYNTKSWEKKDKSTPLEFLSALVNLDPVQKNKSLYSTLLEVTKLKGDDLEVYEEALELNLEIIYCNLFPEDDMMVNLEEVCTSALNELYKFKSFKDAEVVEIIKTTLKGYV